MGSLTYLGIILIIGLALIMAIYVFQREKQLSANSISAVVRGVKAKNERQHRLDVGASPVFSAMSKLDNSLQGKGLPDIIELNYEPIELREGMSQIDLQDAIVALSLQRQVICQKWKMYGLKTDGGWPVCTAAALIPTKTCTVYSFGIKYDWSFDDTYRQLHGCTIRTFDPSMGYTKEHEHKPGVFFYPIGLSDKKETMVMGKSRWRLDSYGGLLKRFGEENSIIPYLKFDIETMEWKVLENMLADGTLKNVIQLSFEIHVDKLHNVREYFKTLKKLEAIGFRRWFYHHRLNGNPFQCDQSYININYLKDD